MKLLAHILACVEPLGICRIIKEGLHDHGADDTKEGCKVCGPIPETMGAKSVLAIWQLCEDSHKIVGGISSLARQFFKIMLFQASNMLTLFFTCFQSCENLPCACCQQQMNHQDGSADHSELHLPH